MKRQLESASSYVSFLGDIKNPFICAHISTSKVLQNGVLAEYIIYTARHVTVPSHTPSYTPWRAQAPGEIQTPGNYPPSDRPLLHYLCTQHHHREGRMDRGVGEKGTRRDGWKWREIKAERHKMRRGRLRRGGVDGVWEDSDFKGCCLVARERILFRISVEPTLTDFHVRSRTLGVPCRSKPRAHIEFVCTLD